jgi:glycerol-3-phosphate dehydrogenase
MAQHAIDVAIKNANLTFVPCKTKRLQIHGWTATECQSHLSIYGADAEKIQQLIIENQDLAEKIHPNYPYTKAEVLWFVSHEMAETVEDVLARRIRLLFLDTKAAIESAAVVARLLAKAKNKPLQWQEEQVEQFTVLAQQYLVR